MLKDIGEHPGWKKYIRQDMWGGAGHSLPSQDTLLSLYPHLFTNLEAPLIHYY